MAAGVGPAATVVRPRTEGDVFRWLLFAAWIVIMVVGLATMSHTSTFDALQADLSGGVDRVTVAGEGASLEGETVQEVRWRSNGVNHKVLVKVVPPEDPSLEGEGDMFPEDDFPTDGLQRIDGSDVGAVLTAQHPGLRVTRTSLDEGEAESQARNGVRLGLRIETPFDGPVGLAAGIHLLLSTLLIVFGPQPWRATRWAWFWLLGVPYVGLPAMLLLSGPTPGLPSPRTERRLTGGKAFVIGMVTFSAASLLGLA